MRPPAEGAGEAAFPTSRQGATRPPHGFNGLVRPGRGRLATQAALGCRRAWAGAAHPAGFGLGDRTGPGAGAGQGKRGRGRGRLEADDSRLRARSRNRIRTGAGRADWLGVARGARARREDGRVTGRARGAGRRSKPDRPARGGGGADRGRCGPRGPRGHAGPGASGAGRGGGTPELGAGLRTPTGRRSPRNTWAGTGRTTSHGQPGNGPDDAWEAGREPRHASEAGGRLAIERARPGDGDLPSATRGSRGPNFGGGQGAVLARDRP